MEPFYFLNTMDRFAFFVDAGYVYAAGGTLCHGVKARARLELHFRTFVDALVHLGRGTTEMEHLRTYWYDGATHGVPSTSEHQTVASLRGVKLRLGQLNNEKQQKGVDSLIVRDLMRISGEHAIATAFLLGGDEDLRQGMVEAQDSGVKVILVGVEPCDGNQSVSLLREADDHIVLDRNFLLPHLSLRSVAADLPSGITASEKLYEERAAFDIGRQAALDFLNHASAEDLEVLRQSKIANPREAIPSETDRELLAIGRSTLGWTIPPNLRKLMRDAFWETILNGPSEEQATT